MVLLAITVVVGGRATLQEGGVHLLFSAFLFLAVNP
jgi:hypothetical protein